ncbi:MAG: BrnT family toxin [Spirochaetales bacterium]|nr:BrnT family toxin [Spirochaetales bacterium]
MTVISQDGRFEWDSDKNELNVQNHGFSFSEILEVFDDPYLLTKFDANHSTVEEERYFSVGCIRGIVIIAVSHTDRDGRTRIISARKAEPKLQEVYNGYIKQINR